MESTEFHAALALLHWQIELGVTEAIGDAAIDRYALGAAAPAAPSAVPPDSATGEAAAASAALTPVDAIAEAGSAARSAQSLDDLREVIARFEHCDLKRGARNLVFSDGVPGAPVMIVGEAPGREEDIEGRPFVGPAGQLLDRMLAAIGMTRTQSEAPVYITNVLPWRPPQNREPTEAEIAVMRPFLERHIGMARPRVLLVMGNVACDALLGRRGITRLRGQWTECLGLPVLPMFHPAYLLRNPEAKREAWADLLELQAFLRRG